MVEIKFSIKHNNAALTKESEFSRTLNKVERFLLPIEVVKSCIMLTSQVFYCDQPVKLNPIIQSHTSCCHVLEPIN